MPKEFNLTNGFFKTINKKIKIELNNVSNIVYQMNVFWQIELKIFFSNKIKNKINCETNIVNLFAIWFIWQIELLIYFKVK